MNFLQLRQYVSVQLDDTSFGYFTESIVNRYLNNAQREVQKYLMAAGQNWYNRCQQAMTVVNACEYSLPEDFLKMHRAELVLSGTAPNEEIQTLDWITLNQLDRAILVLDRVRDEFPDLTMYIHYGWEHLDKYGLGDLRRSLEQMASDRPWIKYIGKTSQPDLIRSFKASAYCVQPADWLETSMISALEQLCSGVYQIRRAVGGCVDTLRPAVAAGMAEVLDCPADYGEFRASDADFYAERVKEAMREKKYLRVNARAEDYAWEKVAKQWLDFRAGAKI